MKTTSLLCRRTLTLTLTTAFSLGLTLTAGAEPTKKKAAALPERLVITGEAPTPPEPTPPGPARPMTALDATGTRRAAGEPRMITGSFIPQKFDLYANDTNAALPLQIFTSSDVALKGNFGGPKGAVVAPSYTSSMSAVGVRATPEPEFVHVRTRHVLDLRTVEPGRRLAVATQTLGPEQGRKLFEAFNRWEAARKKRLSVRWTGELS